MKPLLLPFKMYTPWKSLEGQNSKADLLNGLIAKDFIFTLFISIASTRMIFDIEKEKKPKDL